MSDSIDNSSLEPSTITGHVGRVLGQLGRANNNANTGKIAAGSILIKLFQADGSHTPVVKVAPLRRSLELREPRKWVVVLFTFQPDKI